MPRIATIRKESPEDNVAVKVAPVKKVAKKVTKKVTKKAAKKVVKKAVKKVAKKKVAKKTTARKVTKKVMAKPAKPKKKKKTNYLNNKDLLAQVILSKKQGSMSDTLARMLTMLTSNYSKKNIFASYTYNEDMQAYALMMLVRTWHKFDETRFSNPFAFYTQCIKSSFIQYLNQEKRQRLIKDEILVKKGLTPSFNYQLEYESQKKVEDEEDHDQHVATIDQINNEDDAYEDEFLSV